MFSGMNEREKQLNKAELEQMYKAYKEGIFELPQIGSNNIGGSGVGPSKNRNNFGNAQTVNALQ